MDSVMYIVRNLIFIALDLKRYFLIRNQFILKNNNYNDTKNLQTNIIYSRKLRSFSINENSDILIQRGV
jgi:hypothetical protein